MDDATTEPDGEFAAMRAVYSALSPLDEGARQRVVDYVSSRLGLVMSASRRPSAGKRDVVYEKDHDDEEQDTSGQPSGSPPTFEHLAEVFDAVDPQTDRDRALVAAYWLQTSTGASSVDGFSINKELKHLGHGLGNVTRAIDGLKATKPALMIQLKKSGKSQQARKEYKVTAAGLKYIEGVLNGQG
jgi:hypothetical protein